MQEFKPRRPLFALAMSLVLPGFGQLYNGEVNKAIWLFLGFAFVSAPGVALVALYLPDGWMMPALLFSLAVTLSLWLYGMFDAWRQARLNREYQAERWQVSGTYMLVLLMCNALALPLLIDYVRTHQVESFHIPSASMEPTVLKGDILFADKRYNCGGCKQAIQRGDIAIFTYPNDRTVKYIKRIIALPGDRVQINGRDIRVNGKPLSAQSGPASSGTQTIETEGDRHWTVLWGAFADAAPEADLIVPPGQVFVLGDNRAGSTDSRKFGTVPMRDVVGRARQIWFSSGPEGIRWQRLGLSFE
jgi:signal peptidase I